MVQSWSFDYYSSAAFWGALASVALLLRLLRGAPAVRNLALLAASSALLLAIPRFGLLHLALVWGLALAALGFARALIATPGGFVPRRRALAAAGVVSVLAFLAFFKYRFLQDTLLGRGGGSGAATTVPLVLVGASYFSFKAIHVIVEAYKGTITSVRPVTFLGYMTFFPAFISGPIHRYPEWAPQLEAPGTSTLAEDLRQGGERLIHGFFKKLVLVPIVMPYALVSLQKPMSQVTRWEAALGLYACAFYFYFDFAGYSDLAIGGARLMGLRLPENFNQPFLQRNIREVWTNWHMTLTSWLVDYIYWPLVRRLRNLEYFRPRPVLLSVVGMNATFLACGVWHGEAPHFVLWGAYHGLGISVLNVYQRWKRRIPSPALQRYFNSRTSRWLGALAAFHFFAAGLSLFVLDLEQLGSLLAAVLR